MKPLIVIPCRGGSKGVPRKNIKLLNKVPLIHYTIKVAQQLFADSCICVSTDDEEIKKVAEETGLVVPFLRPKELASDFASTYDVLLHAVSFYEVQGYSPDTVILLQPTSPFRKVIHIQEALQLYTTEIDMVVSVKEAKSNPYFNLFEENERNFLKKSKKGKFKRRQDCPKIWEYNGAIYVINVKSLKENPLNAFKKIVKYEMDEFSSHDIDTAFDWKMAEYLQKELYK